MIDVVVCVKVKIVVFKQVKSCLAHPETETRGGRKKSSSSSVGPKEPTKSAGSMQNKSSDGTASQRMLSRSMSKKSQPLRHTRPELSARFSRDLHGSPNSQI
jgi:hypothetical protein